MFVVQAFGTMWQSGPLYYLETRGGFSRWTARLDMAEHFPTREAAEHREACMYFPCGWAEVVPVAEAPRAAPAEAATP